MVAKHKNKLLNSLLEFLNSSKISIARFSNEAGIKKERVYKWYQEQNNAKADDVEKIKAWLSKLNVENVPREIKGLIVEEEGAIYVSKSTDKEKYIELLERDRSFFERSLKDNLNLITANLTELLRSQRFADQRCLAVE